MGVPINIFGPLVLLLLKLLQAQREREKEQEAMLTKELEEAKGALQEARKELAREKVQGAELAVRSQGVQRELAFRIQVQILPIHLLHLLAGAGGAA